MQYSPNQKQLNFDLTGRIALITGGAGLLGEKHAEALLEVGATVILSDIDKGALKASTAKLSNHFAKEKIFTCEMDVTSEDSVNRAKQALEKEELPVSILVNNAALNPAANQLNTKRMLSRLETMPLNQWNLELAVGLTGAFLCSRIFGSAMADRGDGLILNIASDLSVIAPDQRLYLDENEPDPNLQPVKPITYSVIKTGLVGMTRYLATYWAAQGIRVNALSPGGVFHNQSDEFVRRLSTLIPMGRMAQPNEYKGAIQFLCSPASSYMTGQNIIMDGGRSVL